MSAQYQSCLQRFSSSLKFSSLAPDLHYESITVTKQVSSLHLLLVAHYESKFRNRYMFSSMQCQLILELIRQKNWSIEFLFGGTTGNAALTIEYMNEINRTCLLRPRSLLRFPSLQRSSSLQRFSCLQRSSCLQKLSFVSAKTSVSVEVFVSPSWSDLRINNCYKTNFFLSIYCLLRTTNRDFVIVTCSAQCNVNWF